VSSGGQGFLFRVMLVVFVGFIFVAVYWFSGFFYWYFFIKPFEVPVEIIPLIGGSKATSTIVTTDGATTTYETEITIPLSIIKTSANEFLEVTTTEEIPAALSQIMKKNFVRGNITRILIKDKNISIKTAFSGQEISWGDGPKLKILEPEKSLRGQRIQNINNSSIVLKIEYEDVWFFGISSKRYVLYRRKNKEIELVSYKLRGLGHLRNPFSDSVDDWQGEIWSCTDGISENHGLLCREIFRSSKRSRIL
jgi:hypothetical protein